MQVAFYWLEDHFEAVSEQSPLALERAAARRLSALFAMLGDVLAMRAHSRALLTPPEAS
jgi:hypothetical protein